MFENSIWLILYLLYIALHAVVTINIISTTRYRFYFYFPLQRIAKIMSTRNFPSVQVQMLLQCSNWEVPRKKKCAHYRYLTKSFLRTGHFLFRLRTSVHYSGCFVNHLDLHNYTYRMHCPWQSCQILKLKKCFHWCLPGKTYKTCKCNLIWQ
jgi:hypothetical protein